MSRRDTFSSDGAQAHQSLAELPKKVHYNGAANGGVVDAKSAYLDLVSTSHVRGSSLPCHCHNYPFDWCGRGLCTRLVRTR
jgi:hypothetical protein